MMFQIVLTCVWLALMPVLIFFYVRNYFVLKYRLAIIRLDGAREKEKVDKGIFDKGTWFEAVGALPSYEAMLYKFWEWPIKRLRKPSINSRVTP